MAALAVDTSVAVALLVTTHPDHDAVMRWGHGKELALSGPALAETYSVLTRLPGDMRAEPAEAARGIRASFATPLLPKAATARSLPDKLGRVGYCRRRGLRRSGGACRRGP